MENNTNNGINLTAENCLNLINEMIKLCDDIQEPTTNDEQKRLEDIINEINEIKLFIKNTN